MNENGDNEKNVPFIDVLGGSSDFKSHGSQVHEHPTDYNQDEPNTAPTQCEVCGSSIPPNRARCRQHAQDSQHVSSPSDREMTISHVAIAIVPAISKLHAVAIGSSAFKCRANAVGDGSTYDNIYDFDEPSSIFTSGWGGELPDATPLSTEIGQQLVEKAKTKTGWNSNSSIETDLNIDLSILNPDKEAYIFTEEGHSIESESDFEDYVGQNIDERTNYWIVPAVLYKETLNTTNKSIRNRECESCGITKHVFQGYNNGHPDIFEDGEAVWQCLKCNKKKTATPPRGKGPAEPWNDENFTGQK